MGQDNAIYIFFDKTATSYDVLLYFTGQKQILCGQSVVGIKHVDVILFIQNPI